MVNPSTSSGPLSGGKDDRINLNIEETVFNTLKRQYDETMIITLFSKLKNDGFEGLSFEDFFNARLVQGMCHFENDLQRIKNNKFGDVRKL